MPRQRCLSFCCALFMHARSMNLDQKLPLLASKLAASNWIIFCDLFDMFQHSIMKHVLLYCDLNSIHCVSGFISTQSCRDVKTERSGSISIHYRVVGRGDSFLVKWGTHQLPSVCWSMSIHCPLSCGQNQWTYVRIHVYTSRNMSYQISQCFVSSDPSPFPACLLCMYHCQSTMIFLLFLTAI